MSTEIMVAVGQVLEHDIVRRQSFFQLKYFILGKEPTVQAKLWCCVRELRARQESMEAMLLEMDEVRDNQELAQIEIDRLQGNKKGSQLDRKERAVLVRKHRRKAEKLGKSLQDLERTFKETEEEADFLLRAFQMLNQKEPLKSFDDLQSQTEYWNERFSQMLNLSLLMGRLPDTGLVRDILLLDDALPVKKKAVFLLEKLQQDRLEHAGAATAQIEKEPAPCRESKGT